VPNQALSLGKIFTMLLPDLRKQEELCASLGHTEIVLQTAQQIMKDFALFGLEITFSGNTNEAYKELHQQITRQIEGLIEHDYNKLLSVLYQVDISNKDIERSERELLDYNHIEVIAHEIIVRDLKKVLIRNFYKNQSL